MDTPRFHLHTCTRQAVLFRPTLNTSAYPRPFSRASAYQTSPATTLPPSAFRTGTRTELSSPSAFGLHLKSLKAKAIASIGEEVQNPVCTVFGAFRPDHLSLLWKAKATAIRSSITPSMQSAFLDPRTGTRAEMPAT